VSPSSDCCGPATAVRSTGSGRAGTRRLAARPHLGLDHTLGQPPPLEADRLEAHRLPVGVEVHQHPRPHLFGPGHLSGAKAYIGDVLSVLDLHRPCRDLSTRLHVERLLDRACHYPDPHPGRGSAFSDAIRGVFLADPVAFIVDPDMGDVVEGDCALVRSLSGVALDP
jgi:hypothetical protein